MGSYSVLGTLTLEDVDGFGDIILKALPGDELSVTFEADGELVTVEGRVTNGMSKGDTDCRQYTRNLKRENAVDNSITYWDHPIEHYAQIRYGGGKTVMDMNKTIVSEFESIELVKTNRGLRTA